MKRLVPCAACLALLGACSSEPVSLQPGQWETTIHFDPIDFSHMAPGESVQQPLGSRTQSICITPADATDPSRSLIHLTTANCQASENVFSNGTIHIRNTCPGTDGEVQSLNLEGSFTPTTIEARITSGTMRAGVQGMTMSGNLTSRRTGDCATH